MMREVTLGRLERYHRRAASLGYWIDLDGSDRRRQITVLVTVMGVYKRPRKWDHQLRLWYFTDSRGQRSYFKRSRWRNR